MPTSNHHPSSNNAATSAAAVALMLLPHIHCKHAITQLATAACQHTAPTPAAASFFLSLLLLLLQPTQPQQPTRHQLQLQES
jgi:hypothetical protein